MSEEANTIKDNSIHASTIGLDLSKSVAQLLCEGDNAIILVEGAYLVYKGQLKSAEDIIYADFIQRLKNRGIIVC